MDYRFLILKNNSNTRETNASNISSYWPEIFQEISLLSHKMMMMDPLDYSAGN